MANFFKNHPLGAPFMVFGISSVAFGYGNDAWDFIQLGIDNKILLFAGATIFMLSIAGMIYRQSNLIDGVGGYANFKKPVGGSFKKKEPNYEAWDGVIYFSPMQAACLWGETNPVDSSKDMSPSAKACLQMLKEEMEADRLKPVMTSKGKKIKTLFSDPRGKVQRMDLLRVAKRKNQKPKFLFPEARKKSKNQDGWLRE